MINKEAFNAIEDLLPIVSTEEVSPGIYILRHWQGGQFGELMIGVYNGLEGTVTTQAKFSADSVFAAAGTALNTPNAKTGTWKGYAVLFQGRLTICAPY